MSTPAFVPQSQDSLTPIRFYTPFDPYFYSTDNRPLQDIAANLVQVSSIGADSARRAVLISQLNLSSAVASLFKAEGGIGFLDGMSVSLSSGVLGISPGALYFSDVTNVTITDPIVKQAILPSKATFPLTVPNLGLGNVKDYLVQMRVTNITQASTPASNLPFLDADNNLLPGLLLNAEAVVTIKEGASAVSGSQITPTADSGCIPLYVVTYSATSSLLSVKLHASAPTVRRGFKATQLSSSNVLAAGSTTTITVPMNIRNDGFNPCLPIKVRALCSSSAAGGDVKFRVGYTAMGVGSVTTASSTTAGDYAVTMSSTANALSRVEPTPSVPANVFASFVSGAWVIDKDFVKLTLSRIGGDSSDTVTGDVTVLEVQAYQ